MMSMWMQSKRLLGSANRWREQWCDNESWQLTGSVGSYPAAMIIVDSVPQKMRHDELLCGLLFWMSQVVDSLENTMTSYFEMIGHRLCMDTSHYRLHLEPGTGYLGCITCDQSVEGVDVRIILLKSGHVGNVPGQDDSSANLADWYSGEDFCSHEVCGQYRQ